MNNAALFPDLDQADRAVARVVSCRSKLVGKVAQSSPLATRLRHTLFFPKMPFAFVIHSIHGHGRWELFNGLDFDVAQS